MLPIATRRSARLMELKVDEGSQVKSGELLARLEDEDLQGLLNELRAKETFAKLEYERISSQLKQKLIEEQAHDRAKSE